MTSILIDWWIILKVTAPIISVIALLTPTQSAPKRSQFVAARIVPAVSPAGRCVGWPSWGDGLADQLAARIITSPVTRVNAPANDWCFEDAAAQAAAIQRSSSSCRRGASLLRDHIPLSLRDRIALRHMAPGGPRAWFTFPRGVGAKTLAGIEARGWATRQLGITRGGFSFAITPEGKRLFDADAHFRRLAAVPPDLNDGSMPVLKARLPGPRC